MDPQDVWRQFQTKITNRTFSSADCEIHSQLDYPAFLESEKGESLRRVILREDEPRVEHGEDKLIFTVDMGEGHELRLDFKVRRQQWRFYLLDGLTILIRTLPRLPLTEFPAAPYENRMRVEDVVTRRVFLYLRLRDRIGKPEALAWFRDGEGYRLNVEAWMG